MNRHSSEVGLRLEVQDDHLIPAVAIVFEDRPFNQEGGTFSNNKENNPHLGSNSRHRRQQQPQRPTTQQQRNPILNPWLNPRHRHQGDPTATATPRGVRTRTMTRNPSISPIRRRSVSPLTRRVRSIRASPPATDQRRPTLNIAPPHSKPDDTSSPTFKFLESIHAKKMALKKIMKLLPATMHSSAKSLIVAITENGFDFHPESDLLLDQQVPIGKLSAILLSILSSCNKMVKGEKSCLLRLAKDPIFTKLKRENPQKMTRFQRYFMSGGNHEKYQQLPKLRQHELYASKPLSEAMKRRLMNETKLKNETKIRRLHRLIN